jgi:SAM-dependent methyltransferase
VIEPAEAGTGGVAQEIPDRPGRHRAGPDGRLHTGRLTAGGITTGELAPDGQTVGGQTTAVQTAGGQTVGGQTVGGQTVGGITAGELAARPAAGGLTSRPAVLSGDAAANPFTRSVLGYAAARPGQPLALLLAGAATADGALDLARLRGAGCELVMTLIDSDDEAVRTAVRAAAGGAACTLGDLRTVPLPPRSFDAAVCSLLLDRIRHTELVLDRLVDALKPGGLLLLQVRDRDCAAGFLDRKLPAGLRAMAWRRGRPGQPGPYPAVYEQLGSGRGIQSYVLRRGLVIAHRQTVNTLAGQRGPVWLLLAGRLVTVLSRSALPCSHDEVCFVIRKPEDRFARVL